MSVEALRVSRRLSFGYCYSKEDEMRLDRDYPPNHTLAANGGGPPPFVALSAISSAVAFGKQFQSLERAQERH